MVDAHQCTVPEYLEGRQARREGKRATKCPYPSGGGYNSQRYWWFQGWYDEKHDELPATRGPYEQPQPKEPYPCRVTFRKKRASGPNKSTR